LRDPSGTVTFSQAKKLQWVFLLSLLSELQNSGGGTDISTHITASMTYYLEVTTKALLTEAL
jgi:hypothetical protein